MTIARIENGAVAEYRDMDIADIPEHKRYIWRPVVIEGSGSQEQIIVESDKVRRVLSDDLATVKAMLMSQIDGQAEMARCQFITRGSGQALEYREAAEEAARYDATGGQGSYPMLQASVDAGEAANLGAAAALVSQREAAWAAIGAEIRRLRIKAKRDVAAASDATAARAAAQVTWPAP